MTDKTIEICKNLMTTINKIEKDIPLLAFYRKKMYKTNFCKQVGRKLLFCRF